MGETEKPENQVRSQQTVISGVREAAGASRERPGESGAWEELRKALSWGKAVGEA